MSTADLSTVTTGVESVKKSAGTERNLTQITVLSVGPHELDHACLSEIFAEAHWTLCPQSHWTLKTTPSLSSALSILRNEKIPLVICENNLETETWRDLWGELANMPDPPTLIVTSRLADERLWAEALNLGAHDVLAKPFDSGEVVRTLSQAWLRRVNRYAGRKHPSQPAISPQLALDATAGLAI